MTGDRCGVTVVTPGGPIVRTHCSVTITSDTRVLELSKAQQWPSDRSATMKWREEHLWNVSVLQRVSLSNLVHRLMGR
jgi:hypothetical protein